jgi:hypothetical protein
MSAERLGLVARRSISSRNRIEIRGAKNPMADKVPERT